MKHEPERGPDHSLVVAARDGDRRALESLLSQSLPLVHTIVGRALDGHGDVEDVVQDIMLRVVRGLGRLERAESYRSWMVAITVRRIRDQIRERQHSRRTIEAMPAAESLADVTDFASLTILRLHLTDQRREVVEATRWLDDDDRELLSLWWLEECGRLARSELAEALGVSERHAAVRVGRLRERLDTGRDIVRALGTRPPCRDLTGITREWDGTPGSLWRKRIARHLRACERCGNHGDLPVPTHRLLHGLPLVAPPAALYRALGELVRGVPPTGAAPDGAPTVPPASP
ncbi:RNA polymerase sigma factor, partial [Streptomyces calidiresistens]